MKKVDRTKVIVAAINVVKAIAVALIHAYAVIVVTQVQHLVH
ncbi:hypothetical protein PQR67_37030 [Paraburkholderia fungorum]